jgi:peptidyl-prolyl cis-trans isomerase D
MMARRFTRPIAGAFDMMDAFRRAAKSWVAKVLIALLVLSFGIWGIADIFRGGFHRGALASVGGRDISSQEFADAFRRALQRMSQQRGETLTPEKARAEGIDKLILGDLLRGAALDAQSGRLKLALSDETIVGEIKGNPAFSDAEGKFSIERYHQVLERSGLSEAGFIASTRREKLREAITQAAEAGFAPPKTLLEAYDRYENEERDARYFTVAPAETEIPAPTDGEIGEFHDKNIANYTAPEYRSVAIMTAEPADLAGQTTVTDVELKEAYEKYKKTYFTPERRTVMQIVFDTLDDARKAKERIAAGTDFLDIAKEKKLTAQDITLGMQAKDEFIDKKIADAAFKLAPGEVSDPVQGQLSIVLLKAATVTPEHQQTLEETKADLTKKLQLAKAAETIKSTYDAVEDARAAQMPFEKIAKDKNIPFVLIAATDAEGLDKDSKAVAMPDKEELLKRAFESDAGVENEPVATKTDGYLWYEVREVMPAKPRPLEAVKDKVKADLLAKKLREFALDKAKKLVERGTAGAAFEELAKDAGAEVKSIKGLKRNETNAEFDASAVSALFSIPEKKVAYAPANDGKSAKVIEAAAVLLPKFDPKAAGADTARKTLGEGGAADLFEAYQTALQTNLGVTVDETLWREIAGTH